MTQTVEAYGSAANGRAEKLEAALRKHHEWHLANTDPDQHGIIDAEAYAESALCDETIAALGAPAAGHLNIGLDGVVRYPDGTPVAEPPP